VVCSYQIRVSVIPIPVLLEADNGLECSGYCLRAARIAAEL